MSVQEWRYARGKMSRREEARFRRRLRQRARAGYLALRGAHDMARYQAKYPSDLAPRPHGRPWARIERKREHERLLRSAGERLGELARGIAGSIVGAIALRHFAGKR